MNLDLQPGEILSGIQISPIPIGNINRSAWAVDVEFSGRLDEGLALYAVRNIGRSLNRDGEWDHEPRPSSRTDKWLARHRFPLDEALRLARQYAPTVTWNGQTAEQIARQVS